MVLNLDLENIDNYIDKDEANKTEIRFSPDSSLEVGSFDVEDIAYWNTSLQELYEKYKKVISNESDNDGINLSIKSGSDAGYHFLEGAPYVKPDENNDGKTYEEVRQDDKIEDVLQNEEHLQFTRDKINEIKSYVRLIMPKYTRRVEVEDLNRNFWVIGQTMEQICNFLFNEKSPLNDILKNILNELLGVWQNIYLLWGKTKENENALNELGSQSTKSNLRINFNTNGDAAAVLRDIIYTQTGINVYESPSENNVRLNNIYFFGSKKNKNGEEKNPIPQWIIDEKMSIKGFCPWLFDSSNNFIYQDGAAPIDKVQNVENGVEYYPFGGRYLTKEQRGVLTFPRIGCILKYTLNSQIYYIAYDYKHPLLVPFDKEDSYYNKTSKNLVPLPEFEYEDGTSSGQTILSLNKYIYEESKGKELGPNVSDLGMISLERSSFDKRNFSEVLYDVSQLNITYISNTISASNLNTVCSWDLIPSEREYTKDDLYNAIITIFAEACDYGITAKEDYYYLENEGGSGDEIVFVHTGLIPLLLKSLRMQNLIGENEEISNISDYIYVDDPRYLGCLQKLGDSNYSELLEIYDLYNFNSIEKYTKFVNKVLKDFGISFEDYCQEKEITTITLQNINTYKNDYEQYCQNKVRNMTNEELLYLSKDYYPEGGVYGCVMSNPFLTNCINDSGTGYVTNPYITYDEQDFGGKNYYLTKNLPDSNKNTWKCVFTLLPEQIFLNKNKLKDYGNKLMTIRDHFLLPGNQGGGSTLEKEKILDTRVYGTNSSIKTEYNTRITGEINERLGTIEGFKTDDLKNIRMQYLQPFNKFTGYWLYMESGNFLTSFTASPKIIGYNLRSLDGEGKFSFYDSAFVLKAFNPYGNSEKFKKEKINRIYEFNNPELQPLYLYSPDEYMSVRPTILDRGKSDNLRYLSRNGNFYKRAIVDSLIGVGAGIKWSKGLENFTVKESQDAISLKSFINNATVDLDEKRKSKINFSDTDIVYLNSSSDLLDWETKNMLFETDFSSYIKEAVLGYLSDGVDENIQPIYSPIFWFSKDNNRISNERVREFHFLQPSPYDSIHVYDNNKKEFETSHKLWKEFTVEELVNSDNPQNIVVLAEFLKDTITDYLTTKTLVRFSVVRENEADSTLDEIREMVKDPASDIETNTDTPSYEDFEKWSIPQQIEDIFKTNDENNLGILDRLEKEENLEEGNLLSFDTEDPNIKYIVEILNKREVEGNNSIGTLSNVVYYDISIKRKIISTDGIELLKNFRIVKTEAKREYFPYYLAGKSEKINSENRYYDYGNPSNNNVKKDINNNAISGIGSIWKSRYDMLCWYNKIPLVYEKNSIYENYPCNYTVKDGKILVIGELEDNNGKLNLILPQTDSNETGYEDWINSPYMINYNINGEIVHGFYDSLMGYAPQTSIEYTGGWKYKPNKGGV